MTVTSLPRGRPPSDNWRSCPRCRRCGDEVPAKKVWWCGECRIVVPYLQVKFGMSVVQITRSGECDPPVSALGLGFARSTTPRSDEAPHVGPRHAVMVAEKRCRVCEVVKPSASFTVDRRDPTGLNAKCQACLKVYRDGRLARV